MSEIDDVLSESMRRRAAEARLGGGSIADVQQRVVRRRRQVASVACAALVLPALFGLGVLAGRHSTRDDISAASNDGAAQTTLAPSSAPAGAATIVSCAVSSSETGSGGASGGTTIPPAERLSVAPGAGAPTAAAVPVCSMDGGPMVSCSLADVTTPTEPATPETAPVECPGVMCAAGGVSVMGVPADGGGPTNVASPLPLPPGQSGTATVESGTVIASGVDTPGTVIAGSVPPDASGSAGSATVVSGSVACGGPTTWRCTEELTDSPDAAGWRQFKQCEPVFSEVPPGSATGSGTIVESAPVTTVVLDPSTGDVVTATT